MIEIKNLVKRYGSLTAVDDLSLTVERGEIYGFLGPNGAGKTTTIKILTGLLLPTSGSARIAGYDVVEQSLEAKRITSLIPDRPYLYEKLTPLEFFRFLAGLYRLDEDEAARKSMEYLELFGLIPWKDELLEGFSHGMKQKVVMIGALLPGPQVLVIDEPMVGLDPQSAKLVKEMFHRLAEKGTTLLLSTHTLEIAEKLCHRIGILQHGRLIAEGTMEQLRAKASRKEGDLETLFLELTGGSEVEQLLKDF